MSLTWPENFLFTTAKLAKMHRHFYHHSAGRLFNLIERARPQEGTPETKAIPKDICKCCDPSQRLGITPIIFQVSMPERVLFNHQLALDLMWIQSGPVLHLVDTPNHFNAAQSLQGEDTEEIRLAFIPCWGQSTLDSSTAY